MAGTIREAIAELREMIATEREERREADLAIVKQIRGLVSEPKRAPRKVAEPRKAVRVEADGVCQKHTKKHLKAMKPANRAFHLDWCHLAHR